MRGTPNLRVQPYRQPDPRDGRVYSTDIDGWYLVPCRGVTLKVIASSGFDWEHVSVSLKNRVPTWDEMEFVRGLFWRDDETVMQLSVPRAQHISMHRYCLHLWRPVDGQIPVPPAWMVAPEGFAGQTG